MAQNASRLSPTSILSPFPLSPLLVLAEIPARAFPLNLLMARQN